jgi:hypothetical protein
MKKLIAMSLAGCLPLGLAAEDPAQVAPAGFGTVNVLVIEEAAPLAKDVLCTRVSAAAPAGECMAVHRAVLTARIEKVSTLGRGRWM